MHQFAHAFHCRTQPVLRTPVLRPRVDLVGDFVQRAVARAICTSRAGLLFGSRSNSWRIVTSVTGTLEIFARAAFRLCPEIHPCSRSRYFLHVATVTSFLMDTLDEPEILSSTELTFLQLAPRPRPTANPRPCIARAVPLRSRTFRPAEGCLFRQIVDDFDNLADVRPACRARQ